MPLCKNSICYVKLCDTPPVTFIHGKILYHLTCEMRSSCEGITVGEKIRFYRNKRNIHGYALAEAVGLSRYAIMYYENNQSEPLLEDLKKIAVALEIESDKLFDDYYRFLDYPYSAKIKEIRKEKNLLQRELGVVLGVGRRAVERWEHGKNVMGREAWEQLRELNYL